MQPAVRPNRRQRRTARALQNHPGMYRLLLHHRDRIQVEGGFGVLFQVQGLGRVEVRVEGGARGFADAKVEVGVVRVEDEVLMIRGEDHGFGINLSFFIKGRHIGFGHLAVNNTAIHLGAGQSVAIHIGAQANRRSLDSHRHHRNGRALRGQIRRHR